MVGFQLDLYDLKGGTATATLYSNESGSYTSTGETTTYVDDDEESWMYSEFHYFLDRGSSPGKTANVKIVIDYTYPDGVSETLESNEMFVYSGTFITPSSATVSGSADSPTLTVEFTVDTSMVDTSQIDLDSAIYSMNRKISDDEWEYVSLPTPTVSWNGNIVRFVFDMTESLPSGQYKFDCALYYNDWEGESSETFNV